MNATCRAGITYNTYCIVVGFVRGSYGNIETGDNSSVMTFTQTAGPGTLAYNPSAPTLGSSTNSGGAAGVAVTATGAGSVSIVATDGALSSNTVTFTVNKAAQTVSPARAPRATELAGPPTPQRPRRRRV